MDPVANTTQQDKEVTKANRAAAMARLKERRSRKQNKNIDTNSKDDDNNNIIPDHNPAPAFEDATAAPRLRQRKEKKVKVLVDPKPNRQPKKLHAPKEPSPLAKVTAVNEVADEEPEDDLEAQLLAELTKDEAVRPTTIIETAEEELDNPNINITAAEAHRYRNMAVSQETMNEKMTRSMQYKRYDAWSDLIPPSLDAMGVTAPSLATAKAQTAAVAVQVAKPKVTHWTITKSKAKQMRGGDDMPELGDLESESSSTENVTIVSDDEEEVPKVEMKKGGSRAHMEVIMNPNGKFTYPDLPTPVQPSTPLKRKHSGDLALPQKTAKVDDAASPKRVQEQQATDDLIEHHQQTTESAMQRPVKDATGVKGTKKSKDIPVDDDAWWAKPLGEDEDLFGEDGDEDTAGGEDTAGAAEDVSTANYETALAENLAAAAEDELNNGVLADLASMAGEDIGLTTENDSTESSIDESAIIAGAPVSMAADEHILGEENTAQDDGEAVDSVLASPSPLTPKPSTSPVEASKKRAREIDQNYDFEEDIQPSVKKTKIDQPVITQPPAVSSTTTTTKIYNAGPMANFNTKRPSRQPKLRKVNTPTSYPSSHSAAPHWVDTSRPLTAMEAIEERNRAIRAKKQEDEETRERAEYAAALEYEKKWAETRQRRIDGEDVDEDNVQGESMAALMARREAQAKNVAEAKANRLALEAAMKNGVKRN